MVLGILWKDKVSNKIRGRRLKLARHCIRHPELLLKLVLCRRPFENYLETKVSSQKISATKKSCQENFSQNLDLTKIIMLKISDVKVNLLKLKE